MIESSPQRLLLASLTGLLYPLCFPNFDLNWVAWILLLPLFLATEGSTLCQAFCLGWLAGGLAFTGTMSWVVTAMHRYGQLPFATSYALMVLLCAYLGLYVAFFAWAFTWMRMMAPQQAFLSAPFLWVALELSRTYLLSGLPWGLLGYSQYNWLPVIQVADHTGVYGLSFLVVLINAALAEACLWAWGQVRRRAVRGFPWFTTGTALLALALALSYGFSQLPETTQTVAPLAKNDRVLRIGVVQANIDQGQKWDAAYRAQTLNRYRRLTEEVAADNDLIIWPEAATPFVFEQEPLYRAEVQNLALAHKVPLLFGSPTIRFHQNGRPYLLNSAYLLSPEGEILGRYDKRHLVPFGEYIPLRPILFFLEKLVVGIGDFEPGRTPALLKVPVLDSKNDQVKTSLVRVGVAICYEVTFPDLVRDSINAGADLMVTITNDAWFGDSAAPFQHFSMVVFRAVENRVAFARAANTGVSGFIDPYGRILQATPVFTTMSISGQIPVGTKATFYTKHGDVFAYSCVIISSFFAGAALRRQRYIGRTQKRVKSKKSCLTSCVRE